MACEDVRMRLLWLSITINTYIYLITDIWYLIKAGTLVFLKSETKTDRRPAVKITLQYKLSSAFCGKVKIARKKFQRLKREVFRFAVF